jgi:glutamine amidotransferase
MTERGPVIGVIDYGMGNRRSVEKALERAGARVVLARDRRELESCHGLVLPGVGAFPLAMQNLRDLGLGDLIRDQTSRGVPLLGICLGMQLLFETSEERVATEGLGLLPGEVKRLAVDDLRIPHIGWSEVRWERPSRLTRGLPAEGCPFYHVHSFAPAPRRSEDVVGTSAYGERFATVVERDRIFGVQFHPEKSSAHGLLLMANFVRVCAGAGASASPASASAVPARG